MQQKVVMPVAAERRRTNGSAGPSRDGRRTQGERSAASREQLSRAAFELIRDEGYASFRVATVARAAGVSQGRQLHHFPNKDAIALAAVEYGTRLAETRTTANLKAFSSGDDPVAAIAADSKDYYFSASFNVALDVSKSASGNRELLAAIRSLSRSYRDYAERSWCERLVDRGWSQQDAEDVIALTTGLVRGFAVRRMIRADRGQYDRLIARWTEMVYASIPSLAP
jgi:AcrR family transcriptional regulator